MSLKNKKEQLQAGLTLVEVLAGIVLLSIIAALSTVILVQIFNDDDQVSKSLSLKQDTNIMLSSIRQQFYDFDTQNLCFEDPNGRITIDSLSSNNGEVKGNCITNFDKNYPVKIKLVTRNTENKKMVVETTLVKGGRQVTYIKGNEKPCEEDPKIKWVIMDTLPCNSTDNIAWDGKKLENGCPKDTKDRPIHNLQANLNITNQANFEGSPGVNFQIAGNVYATNQVHFKNNSLVIGKSACFKGQLKLNGNDFLKIGGSAQFEDQAHFNGTPKSQVQIGGNLVANNQVHLNNTKLDVGRNLTDSGEFKLNNSILNVGGTADFGNQAHFNSSEVDIKKKATFENEVHVNNSIIKLDSLLAKNQFKLEGNTLTVAQNADFNGQADLDNSTVTINGPATFRQQANFTSSQSIIGSVTAEKQFTVNKGFIRINLDAIFKDQVDLQNNSETIVNGTAVFENQVNITGSTLKVINDLTTKAKDREFKMSGSKLAAFNLATFAKPVQISNSDFCIKYPNKLKGAGRDSDPLSKCQALYQTE